jgi:hypothetical protein
MRFVYFLLIISQTRENMYANQNILDTLNTLYMLP